MRFISEGLAGRGFFFGGMRLVSNDGLVRGVGVLGAEMGGLQVVPEANCHEAFSQEKMV